MRRESLVVVATTGAAPPTRVHELVVRDGGVAVSPDDDGDVHAPFARAPVYVFWQGGQWLAQVNDDADEGNEQFSLSAEPLVIGGARLRLAPFDAQPLDDVVLAGTWALFGRRRNLSRGRWPAVRVRRGIVERALAIVHRGKPNREPLLPPLEVVPVEGFTVELFAACDGITAGELFREIGAALEPGLAQCIFAPVAALAQQVPNSVHDVVLTFDGDVRYIERPAGSNAQESIERVVGPHLRYGDPNVRQLNREDVAALVRGVAAERWREERDVREQLAVLDYATARAFFEEAAERTSKRLVR